MGLDDLSHLFSGSPDRFVSVHCGLCLVPFTLDLFLEAGHFLFSLVDRQVILIDRHIIYKCLEVSGRSKPFNGNLYGNLNLAACRYRFLIGCFHSKFTGYLNGCGYNLPPRTLEIFLECGHGNIYLFHSAVLTYGLHKVAEL